MKYYVHIRNEELFFNVRALGFKQATAEVDKVLDVLGMEHDFEITTEPMHIARENDFQLRVNKAGQLKGACFDAIHNRIFYDKQLINF